MKLKITQILSYFLSLTCIVLFHTVLVNGIITLQPENYSRLVKKHRYIIILIVLMSV